MDGAGTGRLLGKVALISGGARGQGEAEARLFAREGAHVVLSDVLDRERRTARGGAWASSSVRPPRRELIGGLEPCHRRHTV